MLVLQFLVCNGISCFFLVNSSSDCQKVFAIHGSQKNLCLGQSILSGLMMLRLL